MDRRGRGEDAIGARSVAKALGAPEGEGEAWAVCFVCQARYALSALGENLLHTLNAELGQRGERPLAIDEMGVCGSCRPAWREKQRANTTAEHAEMVRVWDSLRRGDTELRFVDSDLRERFAKEFAEAIEARRWWREHGRYGCTRGDLCRGHRQ